MGNTFKLGNYVNGIFQDSSNNIGIGAAPSGTYKLEVTGTAKVSSTLLVSGALSGTSATFTSTITSNNAIGVEKNGSGTFGGGGRFYLYNAATTDGFLMQLNASNNIDYWGVTSNTPTASPVITFTRAGAATFSSSVTAGSEFISYTGITMDAGGGTIRGGLTINYSTGEFKSFCGVSGNSYFQTFYTNGSERMRITSGGQLSTTFNSVDNNAVFANINSNPYGPWIKFTTDPNNTTNYYLVCSALVSGTEYNKLKITSNGNVYNVTGTYTSGVSDIRYKEQVVDANSQWNDIKSLRVVNFKFIKDVEQNGDNALRQIGFIAQEVEKVSPNLIDEMSDEKTGETWKTIKASIIHTKAIKALQEAMTRIETLEATITSLQDRLDKAGL